MSSPTSLTISVRRLVLSSANLLVTTSATICFTMCWRFQMALKNKKSTSCCIVNLIIKAVEPWYLSDGGKVRKPIRLTWKNKAGHVSISTQAWGTTKKPIFKTSLLAVICALLSPPTPLVWAWINLTYAWLFTLKSPARWKIICRKRAEQGVIRQRQNACCCMTAKTWTHSFPSAKCRKSNCAIWNQCGRKLVGWIRRHTAKTIAVKSWQQVAKFCATPRSTWVLTAMIDRQITKSKPYWHGWNVQTYWSVRKIKPVFSPHAQVVWI